MAEAESEGGRSGRSRGGNQPKRRIPGGASRRPQGGGAPGGPRR